ncbi:50S ribosomal protein L11 methyltransferase [Chromohalobacter sp. 48-RD10]|uniref:50S ribosomal protein L11 methyltransferase n=1 Tax=Chromohalobacter sp. 48-RD10 TaxID=2994063 RepID=UPI0024688682|nr:50S ribosomal protein L11 methyltransferase [Chromohalobacter sp. 48-RD10]
MSWLQLKAHIAPQHAETLEELLLAEGAQAITLQDAYDDPVFEPESGTTPLWDETVLTGLYDDLEDIEPMLDRVRQQWAAEMADEPCPEIDYELLADRDWEREWMGDFTPLKMGERLWVVPSWHAAPEPDAVNLLLDPGLAFGTGTHPTTALCLGWLDGLDLDASKVLDFGCGSGILAIAALKLGADHATGTDIDSQALQASRENAQRNAIADEHLSLCYPERLAAQRYEVVVANILAGPLVELAPTLCAHLAPRGRLALSGILAGQAEEVMEAYRAQGIDLDTPCEREGWVRITGVAAS